MVWGLATKTTYAPKQRRERADSNNKLAKQPTSKKHVGEGTRVIFAGNPLLGEREKKGRNDELPNTSREAVTKVASRIGKTAYQAQESG